MNFAANSAEQEKAADETARANVAEPAAAKEGKETDEPGREYGAIGPFGGAMSERSERPVVLTDAEAAEVPDHGFELAALAGRATDSQMERRTGASRKTNKLVFAVFFLVELQRRLCPRRPRRAPSLRCW